MKFETEFSEVDQNFDTKFNSSPQEFDTEFNGITKIPGKDGASAYEIAVKNGFEGSEVEWLESLKGAPGKDGSPGADGQPGYSPVKGKDYFTAADKNAMVSAVLAALPAYNGEVGEV